MWRKERDSVAREEIGRKGWTNGKNSVEAYTLPFVNSQWEIVNIKNINSQNF